MKLRRNREQEEAAREETQRKLEEKRKKDDQRKRQISDAIKRLEGHLKTGSLDLAMLELDEVKKLDRRNPYVGAFEERIQYVRQEQEKKKAEVPLLPVQPTIPAAPDSVLSEQVKAATTPTASTSPKVVHSPAKKSDIPLLSTQPPQRKTASQKKEQVLPAKSKILVIEDDPGTLLLISHILTEQGYDVLLLQTSDEALVLLQRLVPDLIISDVNLSTSTMGGFTLYEEIRRHEHLDQVPFIVITSHVDERLQRIGKEMGIDEYLTKPVHKENLLVAVRGKLKRFAARKRKG